jgi:hypothetical protein
VNFNVPQVWVRAVREEIDRVSNGYDLDLNKLGFHEFMSFSEVCRICVAAFIEEMAEMRRKARSK